MIVPVHGALLEIWATWKHRRVRGTGSVTRWYTEKRKGCDHAASFVPGLADSQIAERQGVKLQKGRGQRQSAAKVECEAPAAPSLPPHHWHPSHSVASRGPWRRLGCVRDSRPWRRRAEGLESRGWHESKSAWDRPTVRAWMAAGLDCLFALPFKGRSIRSIEGPGARLQRLLGHCSGSWEGKGPGPTEGHEAVLTVRESGRGVVQAGALAGAGGGHPLTDAEKGAA